jgi:hypothetical protein
MVKCSYGVYANDKPYIWLEIIRNCELLEPYTGDYAGVYGYRPPMEPRAEGRPAPTVYESKPTRRYNHT